MTLDLSDEAKAALAADGPLLILGGPGSGKTTLSLLKAQLLIPELKPGQEILFLSFSRAAVRQVIVRCRDVLTHAEREQISIKTYHAFFMEILRVHGRLLTGHPPRLLYPRETRLLESQFGDAWPTELERLAAEDGHYGFDQFAASTANLLMRAARVRRLLADKYPVVILDEFQDTNDAQWAVITELASECRLITLADPDQRIFDYDKTVDPERLDQLSELMNPATFDLGQENHRSPEASILAFAEAVFRNRPLPSTSDVVIRQTYGKPDATVHAAVVWMLSALGRAGVQRPSVAVLCRSNVLVSRMSQALRQEHTVRGTTYQPVQHEVAWDPELAAAAANVVASILEWSTDDPGSAAANTLDAIANYYDHKNAGHASASATKSAVSYRRAAEHVRAGNTPRPQAAKDLLSAASNGFALTGRPPEDWRRAQDLMADIKQLVEVSQASRLVRLFHATDEIGRSLADRWNATASYGRARELVQRALDQARMLTDRSDHQGVLLMNVHQSKGKEFDGVLVVEDQYVGRFFDPEREDPPFWRTRMLLRVAITRARHKVVIIRPANALPLTGIYTSPRGQGVPGPGL